MTIPIAGYRTLIEALEAAPPERLFVLEWHDENDRHAVTFGEFRDRSAAWASFLRQQGARSGEQVAFILKQSIGLMAAFAGAMRIGALPAILAYPSAKVEHNKYRSGLRGISANLQAPLLVVDEAFPEELLVELAAGASANIVRATLSPHPRVTASSEPAAPASGDSLAFLQHSSGTTGLQKGVALTHRAVLRQLGHLIEALKIGEDDKLYSWLPLYHDMGLIACFLLPMVCHLPVVMQTPTEWVQRPSTMLYLIRQHRCTLAWMPNFAFQFIPRRTPEEERARIDLSSLRALINCSEPVRAQSMEEFRAAFAGCGLRKGALQSSYAMAENVFAVTQSDENGPLTIHVDARRFRSEGVVEEVAAGTPGAVALISSGRLLAGNRARIISGQDEAVGSSESLPELRVGEILIQSDSLFAGYHGRPELTAEVMKDGWYCTGDLGFFCREELFVVGRKKDLLIIGGENIYPQDVEEAVCAHPGIHDGRAVAIGLLNAELGTEDLAVVAEVETAELLGQKKQIEREIRAAVLVQVGVAVRFLFLKPPKWIVKSTSGKASRSGTREKLLSEHPELAARDASL